MFKHQSISPIIFRYQHFLLKLLKKYVQLSHALFFKDYLSMKLLSFYHNQGPKLDALSLLYF